MSGNFKSKVDIVGCCWWFECIVPHCTRWESSFGNVSKLQEKNWFLSQNGKNSETSEWIKIKTCSPNSLQDAYCPSNFELTRPVKSRLDHNLWIQQWSCTMLYCTILLHKIWPFQLSVWYRIARENGHYVSIASGEEQSICKVFLLYLYLWPSGYYYCRRIRNSGFPRQTQECSIVPRKACEADHQLWHKIPNKWRQLASNWSRTISFQSAAINMAQVVGCSYHLDQSMIKLCFTKAIPSRSTSRRL